MHVMARMIGRWSSKSENSWPPNAPFFVVEVLLVRCASPVMNDICFWDAATVRDKYILAWK